MSKKQLIEVFYGDRIAHESERLAIGALRAELERRQIAARLLINFYVSHGTRQVDLVIVTERRCMLVELKSLDMGLPVIGTVNGPWRQVLPDGSQRSMDKNFYIQAKDQTYGLSDAMHQLANTGRVPRSTKNKFFGHIDTLVCMEPRIPNGSTFQKFQFVDVIGLDILVDRLTRPGRGLPSWTSAHWDEFVRHLGLYAEADDEPEALRRRADAAAVEDYRRRFRQAISANLHQLIPAAAHRNGQPVTADAESVAGAVARAHDRALLLGASGDGKTHLATHTAIRLTDEGQMVVWLPADDYKKGQFGLSLSRAVGPYSTETHRALLQKAADGGLGITVVIDALETSHHRVELLNQLNALLLQVPASVLVTASTDDGTELLAPSTRIELAPPASEERTRLATSYGTSSGVAESEEFRTRFDLAVAAQVITELPADASTADVLDSYIRRQTQNETVRAGLRHLAHKMDTDICTAIPVIEAMSTLRRCPPLAATPSAIDDILASRLISVHQGRLRFSHERLASFLAAEHLVLSSADGADLGRALSQPAHRDLREHAIRLERDPARRYEAIRQIGEGQLFADAARGNFGGETAKETIADITELLVQAAVVAPASTFDPPVDPQSIFGTWHCQRQWSSTEQALFSAAGKCVNDGLLVREVGALLDATDEAVRVALTTLSGAGHAAPISTVIASTYGLDSSPGDTLPATILASAAQMSRPWSRPGSATPNSTNMWHPNPHSWGRLYMAAQLSQPIRHPDDAHNLPDLVRAGWEAGGYHLRLELLNAAQSGCRVLESADRQRMIDVLDGIEPQHIFLSSLYIEVLASYGQITPMNTLEGLRREIADALSDENDPDHHMAARSIVAGMFEDERVLGPYSEAVESLSEPQRLKLYAMSLRAPGTSFGDPWVMKQLADGVERADDMIGQALADAARAVRDDNMVRQEDVAVHLHALRGWAKVADTLPPAPAAADDPFAQAWRCIGELLFDLFRGADPTGRSELIWDRLLSELRTPAVVVLCEIRRALIMHYNTDEVLPPHDRLVNTYPDQARQLLEWALAHRDQYNSPQWRWRAFSVEEYIVQTLGAVGVASTADMLHHYVYDSELGHAAVGAIKEIETRTLH